MKRVPDTLLINEENEAAPSSSPEHVLLLRVLERALRDLTHRDRLVRAEAVQWFVKWENSRKDALFFTYKDVRDHIDLKVCIVDEIKRLVNRAMLDELI